MNMILEKDDPTAERAKAEANRAAIQRKHLVQVARQKMNELRSRAMEYSTQITTDKHGRMVVTTYRKASAEIRNAIQQLQSQLKAALNTASADKKYLDAHDDHHDEHMEQALEDSHEVEKQTHFMVGHAVLKFAKHCKHCSDEVLHCLEHSLALVTGQPEQHGRSLAAIEYDFTNPELVERMGATPASQQTANIGR